MIYNETEVINNQLFGTLSNNFVNLHKKLSLKCFNKLLNENNNSISCHRHAMSPSTSSASHVQQQDNAGKVITSVGYLWRTRRKI
jgi:hypothetical protein